jgi:hypothetical protein
MGIAGNDRSQQHVQLIALKQMTTRARGKQTGLHFLDQLSVYRHCQMTKAYAKHVSLCFH